MNNWILWNEGDAYPEPGEYWVTAPGIGGVMETYGELLEPWDHRSWRYSGVQAYMPKGDELFLRPKPYV